MEFLQWLFRNFGIFFGGIFLLYLFLVIKRITDLYDLLRYVPGLEGATPFDAAEGKALAFLEPFWNLLDETAGQGGRGIDSLVDAIWAELECRVNVHFVALHGYGNTLVLVGFAGTIFGSISAFNLMTNGVAEGQPVVDVFVASWNNGLATALYTSLGAAVIGAAIITIVCSRWLLTRARRLEALVALRVAAILNQRDASWPAEDGTTPAAR